MIYQKIKHFHELTGHKENINMEDIYQTMETIKMYEQYYTKEQIEQLKKRTFHIDEDSGAQYAKAWNDIFSGLKLLLVQHIPADDNRTKPFADRAMELKAVFTGNDAGI